ncbi:unnamed protein product [Boreogadus saida]
MVRVNPPNPTNQPPLLTHNHQRHLFLSLCLCPCGPGARERPGGVEAFFCARHRLAIAKVNHRNDIPPRPAPQKKMMPLPALYLLLLPPRPHPLGFALTCHALRVPAVL